nr:MAG TPA: chitosanase [Caudoviricetes sp.]
MLGNLSKKYESNGDPGCISNGYGDAGGKSYGMYQLASNVGSVDNYIKWLRENGYWFAENLAEHPVGSIAFDDAWHWLADPANGNKDVFASSQHKYIKAMYYDRACAALEKNMYHVDLHSDVMKDVVWSRAVQYGAGNIVEMFTEAAASLGYPNLSYVDAQGFDGLMIDAIYMKVCSTPEWTNGSPTLRDGLYLRFKNECHEALMRLK